MPKRKENPFDNSTRAAAATELTVSLFIIATLVVGIVLAFLTLDVSRNICYNDLRLVIANFFVGNNADKKYIY